MHQQHVGAGMHVVEHIFIALGGPTALARELPAPVQTVHSWKKKRLIPAWRRPQVLDVARRRQVFIDPQGWAYLAGGLDG